MCADPVTLTVVGATLFSAVTTAQQGFSAASVARYNASQQRNAAYAQETQMRMDARRQIGDQTVALANSGGNVDTGTPLLLLGQSARNATLDALTVRQTGNAKANAYESQASGDETAGIFGAGAQLLNGGVKLQQLGAINPPASTNLPPPVVTTPNSFYAGRTGG